MNNNISYMIYFTQNDLFRPSHDLYPFIIRTINVAKSYIGDVNAHNMLKIIELSGRLLNYCNRQYPRLYENSNNI